MNVCSTALDLNGRLISSDQLEYHESLRINFGEMTERLAEIFGEPVSVNTMNVLEQYAVYWGNMGCTGVIWGNMGCTGVM